MKPIAQRNRWQRFAAAMPEEGKLCYGAAAACLSLGVLGWLAGSVVPAMSDLSGLVVVGVLYSMMGLPSLFRVAAVRTGMQPGERTAEQAEGRSAPADRPSVAAPNAGKRSQPAA